AWQKRGTVTAGITTPAATARDAASVEALAGIFIELMPGQNALGLRASGATDNSDNIYDILFMRGDADHYDRAMTLTFTTGTQTSPVSGEEFADLIAVSNKKTLQLTLLNASALDDYIGTIQLDVFGVTKVAIIPTTIVTSSSIWYYGV
ncbi:unnamed protein product, partial [marine sediment metagenome]